MATFKRGASVRASLVRRRRRVAAVDLYGEIDLRCEPAEFVTVPPADCADTLTALHNAIDTTNAITLIVICITPIAAGRSSTTHHGFRLPPSDGASES